MVQENVIQEKTDTRLRHERVQNRWAAFIGIGITVVLFTVILAVRFSYVPSSGESSGEYDSYYISKKFIIERLKAPSTAKFPNPFENDGSVKISLIPGVDQPQSSRGYRVVSWVDAQNAFGVMLRKRWICEVSESTKPGYWKVIGTCGLVE